MRILDRSLNPASEGAYRDLESMKADLDELVNSVNTALRPSTPLS